MIPFLECTSGVRCIFTFINSPISNWNIQASRCAPHHQGIRREGHIARVRPQGSRGEAGRSQRLESAWWWQGTLQWRFHRERPLQREGAGSCSGVPNQRTFHSSPPQGPALPETYLEKKRREAQSFYIQEQQYLKDNKENIEKIMQAELEAQRKEMGGTILGMMAGMSSKPNAQPADTTSDGSKPDAKQA